MNHFVSPVGNVELDNDCPFSIDLRSTRSRESISKEDIPFYFKQFIEPKYGLNNINVTNVASFMKDLEMNWTKLTPDLKDKVLDIMVDGILNDPKSNYDFKNKLLEKLGVVVTSDNNNVILGKSKSTFGEVTSASVSSTQLITNYKSVFVAFAGVMAVYVIFDTLFKPKRSAFSRIS